MANKDNQGFSKQYQTLEDIASLLKVSKQTLRKDIKPLRPKLMELGNNKLRIRYYNPVQVKLILDHYKIEL